MFINNTSCYALLVSARQQTTVNVAYSVNVVAYSIKKHKKFEKKDEIGNIYRHPVSTEMLLSSL